MDGPHLRDPLGALQSALQLGQTALQLGQSVAHVVKVALQVPGDLGGLLVVGFDAVRQLFELFGVGLEVLDGRPGGGELGLEGHGVFRQGGEGAGGVGQGLRGGVQVAGQGGQGAVQGIQLGQSGVGAVIDLPLAAGDGAPGGVEPVQTAGGGAEAAAHAVQGVEYYVHAVIDGVIGVLRLFLGLPQVRDLVELLEGGGDGQQHQAGEGKVVAAHPDGEVLLLAGHDHEQNGAQVAHELDLSPRGLQRENVVGVEGSGGGEDQVVAAVLRGAGVGQHVQVDLHQAGLACKVLGQGRGAVELIGHREGPGQAVEGLLGLALEVEPGRGVFPQIKGDRAVGHGGDPVVGEVDDGVVGAVIGEAGVAVGLVALDHAGIHQAAVVVQGGVIGLVADGLQRSRGQGRGAQRGGGQNGGEEQRHGAPIGSFHRERSPFSVFQRRRGLFRGPPAQADRRGPPAASRSRRPWPPEPSGPEGPSGAWVSATSGWCGQ